MKNECATQIDRLNNQIALLKQAERNKQANQKSVALAKEALRESASHKEVVDTLIEKIYVFPENRIEIQWKVSNFATSI